MTHPTFRLRALLAGLVVGGALTLAGLPLVGTGADALPEPDDPAMAAGATFLVSGGRPPTPYDPQAARPAVSGDGSRVAYDAGDSGEGGGRSIQVRGTDTGEGPDIDVGGDSTAPSLSGDGGLVAFVSAWDGSQTDEGDGADVYVGDLSGEAPVTSRVTDLPSDLPYQRVPECASGLLPGEGDVATTNRCGPVLSGDGSTLAFRARLSTVSPDLEQVLDDEGPADYLQGDRGLASVDLDTDLVYRVLTVRAGGERPVRFTRVRVNQGRSRFSLFTPGDATRCAGATLAPDGVSQCQVAVRVERSEDGCDTVFGTLRFDGPTPRSRTTVRLVADQLGGCDPGPAGGPAASRVDACTPHPRPESPPYGDWDTGATRQIQNFGQRPVGVPAVRAQRINNFTGFTAAVDVFGAGCAFQLVRPDVDLTGPSSDPGQLPCRPGQELEFYEACTAYVSFRPGSAAAYAASVNLVDSDTGVPLRRFRLVGAGTRDVVVVRRDPTGSGRFTGADRPPARVASVDQAGEAVDGVSPSLSHDGRYLAFASTRDGWHSATQVFVHDTDAAGDRTFRRGATVLASRLRPGAGGLPDVASQPSLSGDGTRVAFTTVHRSSEGTITYVRVRDLTAERTVVVSAAADGTFAEAASYAPSLSADGGAVAYVSYATNLLDEAKSCCSPDIYVRDLAAYFGGATLEGSPNDIVSLAADGSPTGQHVSGAPAVNEDGSVVAFVSTAQLVPEAIAFDAQVFARARFAQPVVSPDSIEFPTQQVDTVGPTRTVTVGNLGPGPAAMTTVVRGPFQVTDGCNGTTLHRGETCVITVSFAPTSAGEQEGSVTVTSDTFAWTGDVEIVGLGGASVPLLFTIEPGELDFPETGIGLQSEPITVTATNLGSLPMTLAAALTTGDESFAVAPTEACAELAPGASCEVETTFVPRALGDLAGQLQVVGTVAGLPYTQDLPTTGTAAEPTVELSPEVTREGRVVFVSGEHFLPGVPVRLTWDTGQVAAPVITPDEEGTFSAPVVILSGRGPGVRNLTVSMPDVEDSDIEAPPLLVVLGSAQPPDFVTRN